METAADLPVQLQPRNQGIIIPRLLWIWFVIPHFESITWLYTVYPLTWLAAAVLSLICFRYYLRKAIQKDAEPATAV